MQNMFAGVTRVPLPPRKRWDNKIGVEPLLSMEEFYNLMNGQCHMVGVLEGVVGAFYGDEFDDVVFGEAAGFFHGNHFILCTVNDDHAVGEVEVFMVHDVEAFQVFEEGFVHFHFSFKAYGDFFSFTKLILIVFREVAHHGLVHTYRRAAEGDFCEGVSFFYEVAEGEVAAEAGGVVINPFGFHFFPGVFRDQGKVGEAFFYSQLFPGVHAVAGPVEGDDRKAFVLGGKVFSEVEGACCFLAASEAVGDDDHVVKGAGAFVTVIDDEAASYAVAAAVDIKMFFHSIASF